MQCLMEEYESHNSVFHTMDPLMEPDEAAKIVAEHVNSGASGPVRLPQSDDQVEEDVEAVTFYSATAAQSENGEWQLIAYNSSGQPVGLVNLPPLPDDSLGYYQILCDNVSSTFGLVAQSNRLTARTIASRLSTSRTTHACEKPAWCRS